ncbi:ABC transporter permease [Ancylomarina salipaludis]|uniref:ABC transporter permease n=1 Tax=Ancylomarina salipaludis TaxID=2501299 RepID=A0A4V1N0A1_9BACT|nr:ABC transporter permease [Ancylomarina salipaludis]RXQ95863.1 ABC transporter permease [Ancylomarina salipaludis]
MLKYNIRTALRKISLLKNHTVISLIGLTISLVCVFVITAWTIQELQYDSFHDHSESIYMVTTEMKIENGDNVTLAETPTALAQELKNRIPSVEHSFNFMYLYGQRVLKIGNNKYPESGVAADSKMLEVLNFPLLYGSINDLDKPNSIFITEKLAKKLFPAESPVGKVIEYPNNNLLTVKGILRDIPENSSLKFDFIVSNQIEEGNDSSWWPLSTNTIIKTIPNTDIESTKQMANTIWRENIKYEQFSIDLLPIEKYRYGANFGAFNAKHGNYLKLFSFIGIAILILLLASLNYINLVSAYLIKRTGEVSIRKIHGASSKTILKYFLVESAINSIIASVMAILLSALFIRYFKLILDVNISSRYLIISYILGTIGAFLMIGIISGLYPALLTSSYSPFSKIQSNRSSVYQGRLRNAFVISQFILSISLTIVCLFIIRQTSYLNNFDLGYNSHNIVEIYLPPQGEKDFETIKNNLLSNPNITQVSFAGNSPVDVSPFFMTDNWKWDGSEEGASTSIYRLTVDDSYLNIFQIPLLEGRNFSGAKTDETKVIINEKLSQLLGFSSPIGKILWQGENKFEIIGVVKNFHFQNLSNTIQPQLFAYSATKNRMFVEINQNTEPGLNAIKNQFTQFYDQLFSYSFIDDQVKSLYVNENKISLGIIVFTILTILLSCIGLIGLITFNTELKTKEIGIRKVCGAKITEIVVYLNQDILKWFLVGVVISAWISWYLMTKWLGNFAYKISLNWWVFLLGALIIFTITALTISWQSWKAARANPVETLKYE